MSEVNAEAKNENSVEIANKEEPQNEEQPVSRSRRSTKRLSMLTRTAQEGEAILKGLGHKEDGGTEGRRTTRSSTRGATTPAPVSTPPPAKRDRKTPSTGSTGRGSRRGRPKKGEVEEEHEQTNNAEEKTSQKEETEDSKPEATTNEENGESQTDAIVEKKPEVEKMEIDSEDKETSQDSTAVKEDSTDAPSTTAPSSNITDNGPTQEPEKEIKKEETKPAAITSPVKIAVVEEDKSSTPVVKEKNSEESKSCNEEKPAAPTVPVAEPAPEPVQPPKNDIAAGEPASTLPPVVSDEKSKEVPAVALAPPSSIEQQPTPAQ